MFDVCRTTINQFKTCVEVSEKIFTQVKDLYKGICGVDPVVKYMGDSECEEYKFGIENIGDGSFCSAIIFNTMYDCPCMTIAVDAGTEGGVYHTMNIDIFDNDITNDYVVYHDKAEDDGSDIVRFFNGVIDIINNVCNEYRRACSEEEIKNENK